MKRRVLYVPIEVKVREVYGKILFAGIAAERGWQVYLGRGREVREALKVGPPGLLIENNIPESRSDEFAAYRARGHRIANLCEESIAYYGGRDYCARKIGSTALTHVDQLLVVGARNEADLRQYRPEAAGKIAVTGNPRFDTLMPDLRGVYAGAAAPIRERFGSFLLVDTNFGPVNHFKASSEELLARITRKGAVLDEDHADMLRRWHAYKRQHMEALKPLLAEVAAAKRFDAIVIRPHPTENHDNWREWAAPHGITVAFEGSANAWMMAAAAILHTGCTTGIEGALLDRPIASFVPIPGHEMLNQADDISQQVGNADDFLTLVDRLNKASASEMAAILDAQREKVGTIVANTTAPLSVDRILDAIDGFDLPEVPVSSFGNSPTAVFAAVRDAVRMRLRPSWSYGYRKFDGFDRAEMEAPMQHWLERGVIPVRPKMTQRIDGTWIVSAAA